MPMICVFGFLTLREFVSVFVSVKQNVLSRLPAPAFLPGLDINFFFLGSLYSMLLQSQLCALQVIQFLLNTTAFT